MSEAPTLASTGGGVVRSSTDPDVDDIFAQRKSLAERFSVAAVAYSPDGRDVGFTAPIDVGVVVGGLAVVETSGQLARPWRLRPHGGVRDTGSGRHGPGVDPDALTPLRRQPVSR